MGFLNCLIFIAISSLLIFLCGRLFPRKWICENSFPYRAFEIEKNGKIYEKLKIKKWKTKWPDASLLFNKIFPKLYPKKRLENLNSNKISLLLKESCVAETTHVLSGIIGFFCVKIWRGGGGLTVSLFWAFINIPPILIQRYNRPRLVKSLNTIKNSSLQNELTDVDQY